MADARKTSASSPDGVKEAMERWQRAEERERQNMEDAYEDLEFYAGEQWPEKEKSRLETEGRPALTLNRMPTFVRQVTNDIRLMRPSIKVVAVDDQGDPKTAEVIGGMVRYVENRSDAESAYFRGSDSQVQAGIGHWQVTTEYASEKTFDQEIRIAPIDDGVAVMWDPDSVLPTREDAMWCFQPVDLTHAAFKDRYPDASLDDMPTTAHVGWYGEDYIRVARYWCKKPIKRKLAMLPDGSIVEMDKPEKIAEIDQAQAQGLQVRIEDRKGFKVTSRLMTATEWLEDEQDWLGRFIPIVPCLGEEVRIGRRVVRHGAIRYVKDAQRMYNYAQSQWVEVLALQPKAPFIGTVKNFEEQAASWNRANDAPLPFLAYTPDQSNGGAPPQRSQPPVASSGLGEMIQLAGQDMKDIIGIQDAGLGNKSNETSGRAIVARQREGDVGMYTYIHNFGRAVRHTGTILIDLIPRVYDTQRMIRIMGEDGTVDLVPINRREVDPATGMQKVINDLTVGSYDVVVQQGPGYTTRREEAKQGMIDLLQTAPDAFPLIGDLIAKAQDWPLADQIAKRLRAILPPAILAAEEAEKAGAGGQPVEQPQQQQPGPDDIAAMAGAKKAEADARAAEAKADEAETRAQMAKVELSQLMAADHQTGLALADAILGPSPQEQAVQAMKMQPKPAAKAA